MRDSIYIKHRGKTYRVNPNAKCTRRTCSLFKSGACDTEGYCKLPCYALDTVLWANGLRKYNGVNFWEVKK